MVYKGTLQINNSISEIFTKNPMSEFTVNDIAKAVCVDRDTASKHLLIMVAEKKLVYRMIGPNKLFKSSNSTNLLEAAKISLLELDIAVATGTLRADTVQPIKDLIRIFG